MAENNNRGVSLKNHIITSLKQIQLRQSQKSYVRNINENQIIFCHGPAGTSKTFTACYTGLRMYADGEISKIVLCKPLEIAEEVWVLFQEMLMIKLRHILNHISLI
jgi:phosphate starvation-inducible protein PhoH